MKISIKIIIFLLLFNISFNCFSQGKIDKSKDEINNGSNSSNNNNHKKRSNSSTKSIEDDSFENLIIGGIVKGFIYITYYAAIGNYKNEDHLHSSLTNYPFYNNSSGNYENVNSDITTTKFFRIDLENKLLFSSEDIYGNHLKAKIRPFQYFYLQTDYYQLIEYNKIHSTYSNLSLFNINLCYDRIRFEKFNLGWNVGLNYIGNNVHKAGFSYGFNGDAFIVRNVSLYGSMKWSMINNVPVNEFEIQSKYHRKNYFYTIGYEHLKIATPTYDFISIGGGIYF